MEIFTIKDYWKYSKMFPKNNTLEEEKKEYEETEENKKTHQLNINDKIRMYKKWKIKMYKIVQK